MMLSLWTLAQSWFGGAPEDDEDEAAAGAPPLTLRVYDADVPPGEEYREVTLTQPVNWVGRGPGHELELNAEYVSRRHCLLRLLKSGEVEVEDRGLEGNGSKHGTHLHGVKQPPNHARRLARFPRGEELVLGPPQYEGDHAKTARIVLPALPPAGLDPTATPVLSHTLMARVVMKQGGVATPIHLDNLPYTIGRSRRADIPVPDDIYQGVPERHLKIVRVGEDGVVVRILDKSASVHKQGRPVSGKWLQPREFVWGFDEEIELAVNRKGKCPHTPAFTLRRPT